MSLAVFICAPYEDAPAVRDLHALLRRWNFTCTSTWAVMANGPENLPGQSLEELRAIAAQNDADLAAADVVIVRPRVGAGGEMFAEAARAIALGKRVLWVGKRRILSAYRSGVTLVDDIDDAIAMLLASRVPTP